MDTYQVIIGPKGEVIMPVEVREILGLFEGDQFELQVDTNGKVSARGTERSAGPLADFFEDLIFSDLHSEGCSGEHLKDQLYLQKIRLSTVLDQLAEVAHIKEKGIEWRILDELSTIPTPARGNYKVVLSTRAKWDLSKLPQALMSEVSQIFGKLEQNPAGFKRLRGPHYATYRVAFNGKNNGQYRVIYTMFEDSQAVFVLSVGERKDIYHWLKGLA